MSKLSITCHDFKPLQRNTLRGFTTIRINGGEAMHALVKKYTISDQRGQ